MSQTKQSNFSAIPASSGRHHVQNGQTSRRAQSQGPRVPNPDIYSTLPDLRFLNHSKESITIDSLLDPMSVNSTGKQRFQALKEAEAWYKATHVLLKERLDLCEKLKTGFGEVNKMLSYLEQDREGGVQSNGQGNASATQQPTKSVQAKEVERAAGMASANNDQVDEPGDSVVDSVADVSASPLKSDRVKTSGFAEADPESLSGAIETWLKDIRVSRAKWIAGGRDFERKCGLRW